MQTAPTGSRRLTHAALAGRQLTLDAERVVTRKELAAAARDAMKALALRPTLRLVLAELTGCWGEVMIQDRIFVWPSNDNLIARTGLSERSIRYAMRILVELGLITHRDSANGKRFAIRNAAGELLEVFGFDLTPLYARRSEFAITVRQQEALAEALGRAFDEITIHRRATEAALTALAMEFPWFNLAPIAEELAAVRRRTPRRAPGADKDQIDELVADYRRLRQMTEEAFHQAGSGGKECRLIETSAESLIKAHAVARSGRDVGVPVEIPSPDPGTPSLKLILEACPAILDFHEPILDELTLIAAGRYLRGSLGAHEDAWSEAVSILGPLRAAIVVAVTLQLHSDDVARGTDRIKNPGGYFRALARLVAEGRFSLEGELQALRRKRLL